MKILDAEQIHFAIQEKLIRGSTYIDSLVEYCEENSLEIETVADIIKKSVIFKEKIREEATQMNLLKRKKHDADDEELGTIISFEP